MGGSAQAAAKARAQLRQLHACLLLCRCGPGRWQLQLWAAALLLPPLPLQANHIVPHSWCPDGHSKTNCMNIAANLVPFDAEWNQRVSDLSLIGFMFLALHGSGPLSATEIDAAVQAVCAKVRSREAACRVPRMPVPDMPMLHAHRCAWTLLTSRRAWQRSGPS